MPALRALYDWAQEWRPDVDRRSPAPAPERRGRSTRASAHQARGLPAGMRPDASSASTRSAGQGTVVARYPSS